MFSSYFLVLILIRAVSVQLKMCAVEIVMRVAYEV